MYIVCMDMQNRLVHSFTHSLTHSFTHLGLYQPKILAALGCIKLARGGIAGDLWPNEYIWMPYHEVAEALQVWIHARKEWCTVFFS